jgi:hypothetical protein
MVDQQPHLAFWAVQLRDRQIGLSQRRTRDRERIDRVRLAERAGSVAHIRHQLRRHPHDPLPGRQQVTLEAAGELPAVLDRPQQLVAMPPRPAQQREVIGSGRADGLARELPSLRVDGDGGVRVLVRVDPDDHHAS